MAKIILSKGDKVLREIALRKERMTIGRRPDNDIVIEDLAVSGEHAVIETRDGDSILEDLNSTNGTQVNGQPVQKHFLQDGDVVELARFRIRYVVGDASESGHQGNKNGHLSGKSSSVARIKVLNGPSAGKEIFLNKKLTTLGRPGVEVVLVTQSQSGYCLTHIEGSGLLINRQSVGKGSHSLANGDVLSLSGIQMQVIFK